jgi:hypothetical protein
LRNIIVFGSQSKMSVCISLAVNEVDNYVIIRKLLDSVGLDVNMKNTALLH